jgi:hypothetical protein
MDKFYPDIKEYVLFTANYTFDIIVVQRTAKAGNPGQQVPGFEAQIKGNPAVWEYGATGEDALARMQITLDMDEVYYAAQRRP